MKSDADDGDISIDQRIALLASSPFAALAPVQLRNLVSLPRRAVAPGTTIVRQGERGDDCYVLLRGRVEVVIETEGIEARRVATLEPAAIFGEATLLTDAPRDATVRALEPCDVLVLARRELLTAMRASRDVAEQILDLVRLRARLRQVPGVLAYQRPGARGETITVLKDPRRGRYYRLSPGGSLVWQRLDGGHTVQDLVLDYWDTLHAFAPHAVVREVDGLVRAGFAEMPVLRPDVPDPLSSSSKTARLLQRCRRAFVWNVVWEGVDAPLARFYNRVGHLLYTSLAQLLLAMVALAGLLVFVGMVEHVVASPHGAVSGLWLVFLLVALGWAIVLHELGHALTAKAVGRDVPSVGIGWYWFVPVAFVDTSDLWLAERRHRIAVSLAGPYTSLVLGSGAALGAWLAADSRIGIALWYFALVSYVLVLVNLNPVLEHDGYYVLIDLLDRPNLRAHALAWLGRELLPALRRGERLRGHTAELLYGIGALVYVGVVAVLALTLFRSIAQSWLTHVVPRLVALDVAWLFAALVVVLAASAALAAPHGPAGPTAAAGNAGAAEQRSEDAREATSA